MALITKDTVGARISKAPKTTVRTHCLFGKESPLPSLFVTATVCRPRKDAIVIIAYDWYACSRICSSGDTELWFRAS